MSERQPVVVPALNSPHPDGLRARQETGRALILGGCGFIGSHVADVLHERGVPLRIFDRQSERFRAPLRNAEYIHGDFRDRALLAEAMTGVDRVYHILSTTFPGTANFDPATDVVDNLVGTIALLDIMKEAGIQRIVYLSSGGTIYGQLEIVPAPEEHPLRPNNSYGIVKMAVESYLEMYRVLHGLSPVMVRASNPYGPRQAHGGIQGVVSTFLDRITCGAPIEIWGDGSVVRDYIYVRELAELIVLAGESKITGPLNAGSGKGVALSEVLATIELVSGRRAEIIYKPARKIDVPVSILDVARARDAFGWEASVSLQEGIARTWSSL